MDSATFYMWMLHVHVVRLSETEIDNKGENREEQEQAIRQI